jgi:DNA-binding transcriptional ArsR family regulator
MPSKLLTYKDDLSIDHALAAIAAYPTLSEAVEHLKGMGYTTTERQLENWKRSKAERYEEVRSELAPTLEKHLANDMLETAHLAAEVERVAIAHTLKLLEEGKIYDPSRVARDLSQVLSQSVEKRMTLQERPTQIVEHRDYNEIMRTLQGMGVAEIIELQSTPEDNNNDGR